jgi:DNA polymerase III delta prime subunit
VKQEKGEIDFVVLAPGLGVLIVEVKSHLKVSRQGGIWTLGNAEPSSRSPFEQAEMNRYSLKNSLQEAGWTVPPMGSVVVFTNLNFNETSNEWHPWQSIDRAQIDLSGVTGALRSSFDGMREHFRRAKPSQSLEFSRDDADRLAKYLRSNFEVSESLAAITRDRYEEYRTFLDEQYEALDQLDVNPQLLFEGAAGTGKTLLALEVAKRSAESGLRVLVLCRNRYLGKYLRNTLGEHENLVFCGTYHSLMTKITRSSPPANDDLWFDQTLPLLATDVLIENQLEDLEFDVLVVDEVQDFDDENVLNFLSILSIKNPSASLRLFGDFLHQSVSYQRPGTRERLMEAFPSLRTFNLWTNCRNREGVGDLIEAISQKKDVYRRFRLKGRVGCFQILYVSSPDLKVTAMEVVLSELVKSFPLGEIVVLGVDSEFGPKVLSQSFRDRFHHSEPDDMSSRKKIVSTTIRKFKGLEAQAVIIHDFQLNAEPDLVYTGISRAIEKCILIADRDEQINILERFASSS